MDKNKKTICILMPGHYSDVMGGAQYQVKLLIDQMAQIGDYNIFYITRNYDRNYSPEHYTIIPTDPNSIRTHSSLISDIKPIINILSDIRPDIIYQRVASAYTGAAAYFSKRHNCLSIWHISSDADVHTPRFRLSRNLPARFIERKILNYGIRNINKIISQTQTQATLLDKNFNRKVDSIISNFHPLPQEAVYKADIVKVLWIANLKKIKRPQLFIQLAKDLSCIDNTEFIMMGKIQGNEKWIRELHEMISQTQNLTYLGEIPQSEVNLWLSTSHILVNTSVFEGFSNTFIQAWMREVPVVSLDVNPDNLLDGTRLGFCSRSYKQLVEDLKTLIHDKELRMSLAQQSKDYAFANHSLNNIDKLLTVFDSHR